MPEIQLLKIQISTTCKLSGRIIVLCKYLWKAGGTNGIMTKNLDKRNSQTPGRQYQTALNTEQQRLPLGYNLQKFYPLLAETECQSENKAQQVCVCVYTRVCTIHSTTLGNFIENCQRLDQVSLSNLLTALIILKKKQPLRHLMTISNVCCIL